MRNNVSWALTCLLFAGAAGADEVSGEFLVTSNYVWRGISLSEDAPAVLGGLDLRHDKGWFGSAQVATVRVDGNPEQEAVLRAGLARPHGDWRFDAGVVAYEYLRGDAYDPATDTLEPGSANKDDFVELFVGASLGNGEFRYYRSEDYLGAGKLGNYYDLNYAAPLARGAKLILHYGFTDSGAINDHASQVSDTAVGIAKGPFSLLVTNLADNEDGKQSRNPRFAISWRQSVEL